MALDVGFGLPLSGSWASAENMVTVARRADELGYSSLWTFQRLLHPADDDWGPMYLSVHDPIVALAHVARVTSRCRLGLAVVLAPFYSPILLAKQLTTLDHVSGGRLDVGIGLGWSEEEFIATGVAFDHRGARTEEFISRLKAIWTEDTVSYNGRYYQMPPARVDPRPVQQPRPPILLAGTADAALRRAGRIADGWINDIDQNLDEIGTSIGVIKAAAAEAGRDPARLRFIVRAPVTLTELSGKGNRRRLHGSARQVRGDFERLEEQGATEVFVDLNFIPQVGTPHADPVRSMGHAHDVLEAFAPER